MSMNKREQAEMESLRDQLRLAQSLRFTEPVEPDIPIPTGPLDHLAKGFLFNSCERSWRVVPACSTSMYHSFGHNNKTDAQHPMPLYSTRVLALRALRNDAERQCAKWLADIDRVIDAELAGGKP